MSSEVPDDNSSSLHAILFDEMNEMNVALGSGGLRGSLVFGMILEEHKSFLRIRRCVHP